MYKILITEMSVGNSVFPSTKTNRCTDDNIRFMLYASQRTFHLKLMG